MDNQVELFERVSLRGAVDKHRRIRGVAKPRARETASEVMRTIQFPADSSPAEFDSLNFEDHTRASKKLWAADPPLSGSEYALDQLTVAAGIIATFLKVSLKYDEEWVANHVGSFLTAANSQFVGHLQGSPRGLIRFAAAAATYNGVSLNGAMVTHG